MYFSRSTCHLSGLLPRCRIFTLLRHCNTLQHTATHCNTLQHTATHCKHTARYCYTLQHTAAYCNALLTHCKHSATHCNPLQHTATHRNTPQYTATHRNTPGDGALSSGCIISRSEPHVSRMVRGRAGSKFPWCRFSRQIVLAVAAGWLEYARNGT